MYIIYRKYYFNGEEKIEYYMHCIEQHAKYSRLIRYATRFNSKEDAAIVTKHLRTLDFNPDIDIGEVKLGDNNANTII